MMSQSVEGRRLVAYLESVVAPTAACRDMEKRLLDFRAIRLKAGENLDIKALVEEGRKY